MLIYSSCKHAMKIIDFTCVLKQNDFEFIETSRALFVSFTYTRVGLGQALESVDVWHLNSWGSHLLLVVVEPQVVGSV